MRLLKLGSAKRVINQSINQIYRIGAISLANEVESEGPQCVARLKRNVLKSNQKAVKVTVLRVEDTTEDA